MTVEPRSLLGALAPGDVLEERFRLVAAIGRGGFGDVWRAEELLPNGAPIREIALKLLAPESDVSAWGDEAKLLASCSHPSLVTILAAGVVAIGTRGDTWTEVPFVAMEMLDGETLSSILRRRGPAPWRRVLAWAREVASALDVIHDKGIVHLDLKPSNLFLTNDGAVKVLDFGIARRAGAAGAHVTAALDGSAAAMGTAEFMLEHGVSASPPSSGGQRLRTTASIVGTPGFIAPEVIEQRAVTSAADAYALGACIVELATGLLPQDVEPAPEDRARRDAWWAEVRLATSAGRLRDLEAAPCSLPRGVALLARRLLALDPDARDAPPGCLRSLLDSAWERPHGIPEPPYLGLGALGPSSEGVLFGRDDDVARLGRDLTEHACIVLQGVSGSGKSSLAMAGVVPFLARRDAASGPNWRAIVVRPGADPDAALAHALASIAPELEDASVTAIASYAREHDEGYAFVFDQLEEIATEASPARSARFLAFLAEIAALELPQPIRVVGTLREDFTSVLLAIEPLGERLRDALRFVGAPAAAAVREIIAEPARLAGVGIEGLSEVAADVQRELRAGDGRLPLVAFALSAWWQTRAGEKLSSAAWAELGGVRAIFARLADGVFAALTDAEKQEARTAFVLLCHDSRARRSLPRADLRARARNIAAQDRALAAFIDAGLLVEHGDRAAGDCDRAAGDCDRVEVVHEFLFTAWDRLDGWLNDVRATRRVGTALVSGARSWLDLGRPETRLPNSSEIALANLALSEAAIESADADIVREWIVVGRSRARGRRVLGTTLAAGVALAIVLGLGAWSLTIQGAQDRADKAKSEAIEAKRQATVASESSIVDRELAADAKREAEESQKESARTANVARLQQEQFDRLLGDAKTDLDRTKVRCTALGAAASARPNCPFCASVPTPAPK